MTPTELQAIEKRWAAATECNWHRYNDNDEIGTSMVACNITNSDGFVIAEGIERVEDAEFIANARTDIPALCAALREAWEREAANENKSLV